MVKNWSVILLLPFTILAVVIILGETDSFEGNLLYTILLLLIPITVCVGILFSLKNDKTVIEILKNDFARQNYTIITERPLTLKETYENYELNFGFNYLSGTTTNSLLYRSKMVRYIVVKNEKDHYFELIVSIVHTWFNKYEYRILSKSRIRE